MNWNFFFSRSTNPWENLALENAWLEDSSLPPIFLGYFNSPCVVIGKNQNLFQEVNLPYLFENKLPIVRRTSGGGTVYHDLGCLNLSFITNHQTEWVGKWDFFFEPLILHLKSKGWNAQINPRNSLLVNEKKVGGSAQKVSRGRMISHCSLLFHTNLTALQKSLVVQEKIESKASPSVPSTVMNLEETQLFAENSEEIFFQIKSIFENHWGNFEQMKERPITEILNQKQRELQGLDWRFGRNPAFSLETKNGIRFNSEGGSEIHSIEYRQEKWEVNISPFREINWKEIPEEFREELIQVLQKWKFHLELEKTS